MAKEYVYFKRNVGYTVGLRRNIMDNIGYALNGENQYVAIDVEELRDFKIANKEAILKGLVVQAEAPTIDWETPNALTDEDVNELLKNAFKLKSKLKEIDSEDTVIKILQAAEAQEKSLKLIKIIKDRLNELTGEYDSEPTLADMRGVA